MIQTTYYKEVNRTEPFPSVRLPWPLIKVACIIKR
jgi:hypothetical protein